MGRILGLGEPQVPNAAAKGSGGGCDEARGHKRLSPEKPRTLENGHTRVGSPLRTSELTPHVERGALWPRAARPMNLTSFTRASKE